MAAERHWYALSVATFLVAALVLAFGTGLVPVPGVVGSDVEGDARVTVTDENGTVLATVSVVVADNFSERYTGLSNTSSLGEDEGMLFVYDSEDTRHFVMRRMDFPLDMIFVGADRRITVIHHAALRENQPPGAEPYSGRAKWVLEVPRGYANETGISEGDRIRIEYARTETPPTGTSADGGNWTG